MPYRINPDDPAEVQVKRASGWRRYKKYYSPDAKKKAKKLLAALNINVRH